MHCGEEVIEPCLCGYRAGGVHFLPRSRCGSSQPGRGVVVAAEDRRRRQRLDAPDHSEALPGSDTQLEALRQTSRNLRQVLLSERTQPMPARHLAISVLAPAR